MKTSASIKELGAALAKAQAAMEKARRDGKNPHFKNRYPDLSAVVDAIKEPLTTNGLSYLQFPCTNDKDEIGVETMLIHSSGEFVAGDPWYIPATKADAQGFGSALTYARRYSLAAICGLAPEDDDAEAARKAAESSAARKDADRDERRPRMAPVTGEQIDTALANLREAAMQGTKPMSAQFRALSPALQEALRSDKYADKLALIKSGAQTADEAGQQKAA